MKSTLLKNVALSLLIVLAYYGVLLLLKSTLGYLVSQGIFDKIENDDIFYLLDSFMYLWLIVLVLVFHKRKVDQKGKVIKKRLVLNIAISVILISILFRLIEDPFFRVNCILDGCDFDYFAKYEKPIGPLGAVISFLNVAVLGAFFEELLFRGTLMKLFTSDSRVFGILFTSLLFTIIHMSDGSINISLASTFCFSLIACLIYLKLGLRMSILFHCSYNAFWFLIDYNHDIYWQMLKILDFGTWYWLIYGSLLVVFLLLIKKLFSPFHELFRPLTPLDAG